jgi:hypothetical protein
VLNANNWEEIAQVHPAAIRWVKAMAQDPACVAENTALGDLLDVVKTMLLVIQLPERLGNQLPKLG